VITDVRKWELVDEWRRREIGISGGGSLRRPRLTQGCSAKKKKNGLSGVLVQILASQAQHIDHRTTGQ